jgi:fatty acid desaturase
MGKRCREKMAFQLYLIWYFIMGSLMGNGVPHFVFGAAKKTFKSPFGQRSKPKVNVLWGLSNFVGATLLALGLVAFNFYDGYSLLAMLLGFWLTMLMFGLQIKRFINEPR